MSTARAHLWIKGFVQGVSFRYYTRQAALQLGLTGWVRNLMDGRVEVIIEGEESVVHEMVKWCHIGPPAARVDNIDIEWETPTGSFEDFNVRMTPFGS
jgi:acylphosphatase